MEAAIERAAQRADHEADDHDDALYRAAAAGLLPPADCECDGEYVGDPLTLVRSGARCAACVDAEVQS